MHFLYPFNKLEICFQSESHKNITKSKHSKVFVSPVEFTKVHVQGFVNEPTLSYIRNYIFKNISTKLTVLRKHTNYIINLA